MNWIWNWRFFFCCVRVIFSFSLFRSVEHAWWCCSQNYLMAYYIFVWRLNENFYNFYSAIKYILYHWMNGGRVHSIEIRISIKCTFFIEIYLYFFFFRNKKKLNEKLFTCFFFSFCLPHAYTHTCILFPYISIFCNVNLLSSFYQTAI